MDLRCRRTSQRPSRPTTASAATIGSTADVSLVGPDGAPGSADAAGEAEGVVVALGSSVANGVATVVGMLVGDAVGVGLGRATTVNEYLPR